MLKIKIRNIPHGVMRVWESFVEKIKQIIGFKPQLSYLEFHLTDHCNLNCKGCGHFAPLAKETFANLADYERDLKQLQNLFSNIKTIVLMGGEPLLHPQIEEFIRLTFSFFPRSNIKIYTNGLILDQMPESFWNACRKYAVDIDITLYPPVKPKESNLVELVRKNGLKVFTHTITQFFAFYYPKGDICMESAFERCHKRWYNPMLREGKIYVCHKPATLKYFNDTFGLKIPIDGFVDIYQTNDGWAIKKELNKAPTACKYCALGLKDIPSFPWETSNRVLDDWIAPGQKINEN